MFTATSRRALAFATRLTHDERGGIALLFMFLAIGLFGFVALALDTSMWYSTKRRLQAAADAAARAGAYEFLRVSVTDDDIVKSAKTDAGRYGFTDANGATVNVSSDKATYTVDATISMPATLNFANLFLGSAPTITARASAAAPQSAPPCMFLLEPKQGGALDISSKNARVTSPGCRVQVNSNAKDAIKASDGYIEAAQICTPGGASGNGATSMTGWLRDQGGLKELEVPK